MSTENNITKAQLLEELVALRQQLENDDARKQLALIQTIEAGLSDQLSLQEIYDLVGGKLKGYFDATSVLIAIYDQITNLVHWPYYMEKGNLLDISPKPLDNSFSGQVIKTKEPLFFTQHVEIIKMVEKLEMTKSGEPFGTISKSYMGVPLLSKNQANGMISLQNIDREGAFNRSDLKLLETLASSMSGALENARLFDEAAQRNAELAVVNSVQQGLAKKIDLRGIVDLIGEKVGEIFRADTSNVEIYDSERDWITNIYYVDRGERISFPDGPMPRPGLQAIMIDTRKPLLAGTTEETSKWGGVRVPLSGEDEDKNESYLGVPILTGGKPIGLIAIQSYKKNAYNQKDLQLLTTFASAMSVALENARLFDEIQHLLKETEVRNAELAVINSVQHALAEKLDLRGIYDAVGDKICEIFDPQVFVIASFDHHVKNTTVHYLFEKGEKYYPQPVPYSEFQKNLIANGETVVINENYVEKSKKHGLTIIVGEHPKSGVWVPYKIGGKIGGVISLQNNDREHAFPESDIRLLETLAASMSVALENARLFDETKQRNAELAIINSLGEAMSQNLDVETVIKIVGDKVQQIFNADMVTIALVDEQGSAEDLYSYALGKYYIEGIVSKGKGLGSIVFETRQPLLLHTFEEIDEIGAVMAEADKGSEKVIQSWLGIPIIIGHNLIGGVFVQSYQQHAFMESDQNLLSSLAANMGVAIENARLFDETTQRNSELAVINSVQDGLAAKLNINEIYEIIGDKLREIFDAQAVGIYAADLNAQLMHFPYMYCSPV